MILLSYDIRSIISHYKDPMNQSEYWNVIRVLNVPHIIAVDYCKLINTLFNPNKLIMFGMVPL